MVQNNLTYDCLWLGVGCCVRCRGLQIITATRGARQLPGGEGLAKNNNISNSYHLVCCGPGTWSSLPLWKIDIMIFILHMSKSARLDNLPNATKGGHGRGELFEPRPIWLQTHDSAGNNFVSYLNCCGITEISSSFV